MCFFHSFVGFGEDTSAASCVDLRCIGRYDMITSYCESDFTPVAKMIEEDIES